MLRSAVRITMKVPNTKDPDYAYLIITHYIHFVKLYSVV